VSIKRLPTFAVLFLLLAQGGLALQRNFKDSLHSRSCGYATPQTMRMTPHPDSLSPLPSPRREGKGERGERVRGRGGNFRSKPQSSQSYDLQSYISELERWLALANRLRERPQEAAAWRKQLPDSWPVTAQGQHFMVSTRLLGAALDRAMQDPRTVARAAQDTSARLEALLEDARALSRISIRNDIVTRAKLDDILRRREFRFARGPNESETFWDQLMDRVWQWIGRLLSRAGGHPKVVNLLRWGIVMGVGLILLAWLIYTLTHIRYRRFPAPPVAAPSAPWRDWAQEARTAAARGEFREAIRIIYGAAVLLMGEAGAFRVDPSRTHREYLHLLPGDSLYRPHLVAITGCFEQVWYGGAPASVSDYEAALAELESLA